MDSFKHFLITRFNLKSDDTRWSADRNSNATLNEKWMQHRVQLFKKFCLKSVARQNNKNFTWLIYLDSSTPEKFRGELDAALAKTEINATTIFADGYADFQENHTKKICSLTSNSDKYIITSRLDNDDVIHENFIGKIQERFDNQEFMPVNFVKQFMYDSVKGERLFVEYTFSGHFISLIEKIKDGTIEGCYSRGDRFWNKGNKIIQITGEPSCMELIHEKNLINNFRGFPVLSSTNLSGFGIPLKAKTNVLKHPATLKLHRMSWRKFLLYKFRLFH